MIIVNGKKIIDNCKYYSGSFSQAWGLRFSRPLANWAYVFMMNNERKIIADNLFVFYALDMIWLNDAGIVIDVHEKVKPFAIFVNHIGKAKCMIEFKAGTISKFGIKIGDLFKLDNSK